VFPDVSNHRRTTQNQIFMPIELRKQRDGSLRDIWYARHELNGRMVYLNLGVKVAGTPPASLSLKEEGDVMFERSRATAQAKFESIVEEARSQRSSERLVEKLYEIKTGEQIKSVKLTKLGEEWENIGRRRKPDDRYASQCKSRLTKFADFVHSENSKADEIAHVTRTAARAFLDSEEKRGVTAKTWNDSLVLLRATFQHLLPAGSINPFSGIPTKETETVFRKPFTPEELKAILDAAKKDKFIQPIIIAGVCTAMRRGDCCLLKASDVDLKNRFISVKTAKTGETVSIPIFPALYDVLKKALKDSANDGFVFPKQAAMYTENPDGITWRVRKVLALAGFKDTQDEGKTETDDEKPAIGKLVKVNGPLDVALKQDANGAVHRGEIHAERNGGLRRASVRDFHSFRVTWVTLALTASVPLELVQKVTGHKTTDIVLKHYFQPGREDFRKALESAMPKLLTNGKKSPKDALLLLINKVKEKGLKKAMLAQLEKL
jgi:integrase